MADVTRYVDWGLVLGSTSVPFEAGSLEVGNNLKTEDIKSGGALNFDLRQVVGKVPFIKASLLDPSLVTAIMKIGAGETYTQASAHFRAYEQNGGLGTGYLSFAMAAGVLVPVSLNATVQRKATLDVLIQGIFAAGSCFTVGTTSATQATVTKAFYPTNIVIGSDTVTALKSIAVNWQYGLQDDEQLEPTYYFYDSYRREGNAVLKDVSKLTAARLEDGVVQSVTVLLTDANDGANTVSISLGNCFVKGSARGGDFSVEFAEVA